MRRPHARPGALSIYASARTPQEVGGVRRILLQQSISDTLDDWRDRAHMEVD